MGVEREAQEGDDVGIIMADCVVVQPKPTQHHKAVFPQ